jgi:glycine cleavage system H protein
MNVPADLKYVKSHEWLRIKGDTAVVGITDHAQNELTDVVFVETPAVGRKVKAGEACAVVESVKTASDIYAPVSGEIVAANTQLAQHPELINSDAYGQGWIFEIKLSQASEAEQLLTPEAYSKQIAG